MGYLHAGALDRPLALWKGTTVVHPHLNARSIFRVATCDTLLCDNDDIGMPGNRLSLFGADRDPPPLGPEAWYGSLITGMLDASGLLYRRARYADPFTGTFIQPDPIGIAGGLNAFGFAGGDPVNYGDPLGLCPPPPGEFDPLCAAGNLAAGFGDAISFGGTRKIREWMGADDGVDQSSGLYVAGEVAAVGVSVALGTATARGIRTGSTLATSAPVRGGTNAMLRTRIGQSFFGRGQGLNTGGILRIGAGRGKEGQAVFRAAGSFVERVAGKAHIDLVDLGSFENIVRMMTGVR